MFVRKNGIPFQVLVLPPSHREPEPPHFHWVSDLNPIVMSRRATLESTPHFEKKINNNPGRICYKIPTMFSSNIASLVHWKDKKALTSLSSCHLNSSHSWSKMFLYFRNSPAMMKHCLALQKVEMEMTSSIYKFEMATRQNLVTMKSCCFSIGWCLPICFIEWLGRK